VKSCYAHSDKVHITMASKPWGSLKTFSEPTQVGRNDIEYIILVATKLDKIANDKEVHQTLRLDHCSICYDRQTGHFDESKLQVVPGHLMKLLSVPSDIKIVPGDLRENPRLRAVKGRCTYGGYELRQLIVRSGIYHSSQLAGLRFTEHELSVNDDSYKAARSEFVECSCNGLGYGISHPDRVMEDPSYLASLGDPSFDMSSYDDVPSSFWEDVVVSNDNDSSALTKVEQAFLQGKDIPTGRRKRSPEARRRRALKKAKPAKVKKTFVNTYPRVPKGFIVEDPYLLPQSGIPIHLEFPHGALRKGVKRRQPKPRVIVGRTLPAKEKSKYWYFLRTRSKWNYSLHHPLPGDPEFEKFRPVKKLIG